MTTKRADYTRREIAEIKKRGGFYLAHHVLTDIKFDGGNYPTWQQAELSAEIQLSNMTTRQKFQFLKDNGYTFDETRLCWVTPEIATYY